MGYRKFTTAEYAALRSQHNIMVLVGNGFDIQVTHRYQSRFSPRYPAFYHYLASRNFDSSNLVVQQMAWAKERGEDNWSDIEAAIGELLETGQRPASRRNRLRGNAGSANSVLGVPGACRAP